MAVGAITVYVAEIEQRRTWTYYASAPAIANVLFVAGTMVILIEGLICAIVILPLFILLGAVGGLIMGAICRVTRWPRHAAYAFVALPLLLGIFPEGDPGHPRIGTIERSVTVDAPPEAIWREISNVRDIRPEEVNRAWIYRIGVPLPIEGVTQQTPTERVRRITMGKSVHFDQVVADWEPNRHVRWTYRFDEDSFPPRAFDDHVRIGGRYFDMIDTSYTLAPVDAKSTLLQIRMRYRVSTQFDWYADGVARLLIGNFEDVILGFYQRRATHE
ncbi:MAG: SRPBCC family protein [Casimicrobiaceae bacterium]